MTERDDEFVERVAERLALALNAASNRFPVLNTLPNGYRVPDNPDEDLVEHVLDAMTGARHEDGATLYDVARAAIAAVRDWDEG